MERQPKMRGDIILVPQPSDDSADPLNWSQRKKYMTLGIVSLAAFTSHCAALANQQGISPQAKLYHKSLNDMADTVATAIAGMVAGPLVLVPLTHIFGCCSILLWSMVASTCGSIWSALMTKPNQYVAFTISRLSVGLFSATPTVLGPQMLVDIFFLHERGTVFNTFMVWSTFGVIIGPTLGGFIVAHAPWPWEFWWTVVLQGAVVLLAFVFLEETGFTRENGKVYPRRPSAFIHNRVATYFPGTQVAHVGGLQEALHSAWAQVLIGITPVTILVGIFLFGLSGWFVSFNTLLSVFLQNPVAAGGYGFSTQQNAAFTFTMWIGAAVAQFWGDFFNDRIPLYFVARNSGTWKPEYRLHSLWIPSFLVTPIALGIVGTTLKYHLHYIVLAGGAFLITFASVCTNPVAINYLVECFMNYPTEVNCILAVYRLSLGLGIPFFVRVWVANVGVGWVFGTMAILALILFIPIIILMLYGPTLRQMGFAKLRGDEEGAQVMRKDETA
ncbi:conserved hypothetical protein [Talaromyces stipitatus ATCC 10500]|uniref:Major facilitator superfamily (MFS) profile domain-containing protein n=1 Tax=Talaromyces stipitatus (strain ATCC 10500 / CBS 375.48 / QM 6759 / NRRL 1006) TaxID=441959 RepID=B8MFR6_TALSN|nr:uncharacterized protein TSTA_021170 [Talaromyces stipitatus ATCC 10500]EED17056.1 conserved hypothetical protein [Talaromyces stipitatus ATCC 10500]